MITTIILIILAGAAVGAFANFVVMSSALAPFFAAMGVLIPVAAAQKVFNTFADLFQNLATLFS